MRSMWLVNENGDIWDLIPKRGLKQTYASFFGKLNKFSGFKTKVTTTPIGYDWAIIEQTAEMVPIQGTMYFRNAKHLQDFGEFVGDYSKTLKLFYDPTGRIDPRDQLSRPWYKKIHITQLDNGETDSSGYYVCNMSTTTLSAMWRSDTTIASTVSGIVGEPHVIPHFIPYFFQSEQKIWLSIFNRGESMGALVEIKNTGSVPLPQCEWNVDSGIRRQYAKWLAGTTKLETGRTLVVDSNPETFRAEIEYQDNLPISVMDYQEPNPQYINFVNIFPGNNMFMFNVGRIEGVDITVSYSEQVRAI